MVGHVTNSMPPSYAPDVSGVTATTLQIGGAIGVAGFGGLYPALAGPGTASADHAFALTTLAFAAAALTATASAHLATHPAASHQLPRQKPPARQPSEQETSARRLRLSHVAPAAGRCAPQAEDRQDTERTGFTCRLRPVRSAAGAHGGQQSWRV